MQKHRVFLGSSSESKWLAREIEGCLHGYETIEVNAWYHFGSWAQGTSTLESLENRLHACDFAILLLANDDWVQSRTDDPRPAARDNVLFELGLFMGRLGRDRAFFLYPAAKDFKLPSDLFGITSIAYTIDDRSMAQNVLSPACTLIVKQIERVAHLHRARGMQVRPCLELRVKFPDGDKRTTNNLNHLTSACVSNLKVRCRMTDQAVDHLRVYFDPRLNLHKSTWTYQEDERGRFFWASDMQLAEMKQRTCTLSFDVQRPQTGSRKVSIVAFQAGEAKYQKDFVVEVD